MVGDTWKSVKSSLSDTFLYKLLLFAFGYFVKAGVIKMQLIADVFENRTV